MRLKVDFISLNDEICVDFGEIYEKIAGEIYTGEYIVDPSAHEAQILNTSNKFLLKDITVNKIYSASVSNPQGGRTFYIAN